MALGDVAARLGRLGGGLFAFAAALVGLAALLLAALRFAALLLAAVLQPGQLLAKLVAAAARGRQRLPRGVEEGLRREAVLEARPLAVEFVVLLLGERRLRLQPALDRRPAVERHRRLVDEEEAVADGALLAGQAAR